MLGPLTDSTGIIRGGWHEHKLVKIGNEPIALNVGRVAYNDEEVSSAFNALLMSSANNLMYVGANEIDFYLAWAEQMSKIEGVKCLIYTIDNAPEREGRCDFDEVNYDCDYLWT